MKYIALVILILFTIPNDENNEDAIYWSKDGFYHLTLKSDNTFFLTYRLGYHLRKTWGHWERVNRELHLHGAYSDLKNIPIQVEESKIQNIDRIIFVLNDNLPEDYSLYRRQMLLDNKPITFNNSSLIISSQNNSLKFRVRSYFDDTQVEMGRMITPFRLNRDVISEEYEINLAESNNINIYWDIDGRIFNYDPIERITLKKRFNRLIWVEKNLTFKKSKKR